MKATLIDLDNARHRRRNRQEFLERCEADEEATKPELLYTGWDVCDFVFKGLVIVLTFGVSLLFWFSCLMTRDHEGVSPAIYLFLLGAAQVYLFRNNPFLKWLNEK